MALLTSVPWLWSPAIEPTVSPRRSQELRVLTSHRHLCQSSCRLSRALIRIPCQLEFPSVPHPCSISRRSEKLSSGALRESSSQESEHLRQVFVWPQGPEEDNKQQNTPCPLGKLHLLQKSESLATCLMVILKVLHQCCAFSGFCYSA